jgi:hypothetical protein
VRRCWRRRGKFSRAAEPQGALQDSELAEAIAVGSETEQSLRSCVEQVQETGELMILEHFRGDWNRKGLPKRVPSVILGLR